MSNKKIWSLAIALAVMAALAGLLSVSTNVVQAQGAVTPTPTPIGPYTGFVDRDGGDGEILTFEIRGFDKFDQANDALGANAPASYNPDAILAVTILPATADGLFSVTAAVDGDNNQTGVLSVSRDAGAALPLDKYEFTATFAVDTDTRTNSDETGTALDDEDVEYRATIAVNVMDLTDNEDVAFHLEFGEVYVGNRISTFGKDLDLDPQVYELSGLQSSHKIVSAMLCDESEADSATTCTADADLELGSTIDGTKFPIVVKNAALATGAGGTVRVIVDTDTSKDSGDDNVNDNDHDIIFAEAVTVTVVGTESSPIAITEDDNELAADATVKENVTAGHRFGSISVEGSLTSGDLTENLDGVITDSGRFVVRTNARGATTTLALEYTGNGDLAAGETYEMVLSVNGDTGFVNRTATSDVKVTISAANLAPEAEGEQGNELREDDPRADVLIKEGTEVGTVAASDNESLTYSVSANDPDFVIDRNTGVISARQDIPVESEPADPEADGAVYTAPESSIEIDGTTHTQQWEYVDGETESATPFKDVMRTVEVTVSDGVTSNDQTVEFTITIDVNEPVKLVTEADDLPSGVTYDGTVMRDLNETPTPNDASDDEATNTYYVTVRAGDRETPVEVIDLNTIVDDDDAGSLKFAEEGDDGNASHLVQEGNGSLLLTYIPPNSEDPGRTNWIEVSVTDEVNDGTPAVADQTIYVEVTVIEEITPIQSKFVGVTVPENSTDCSLTDGGGACSIGTVFDNGAAYEIESGVDVVLDDPATADVDESDFSVDGNGAITVNNERDFESGLRPAFIVRVDDAAGDLVGLVSVRVTVTDINEAPEYTSAPATAWVAEDAQGGHAVMTDSTESGVALVIAATDEDDGDSVSYSIVDSDGAAVPFEVSDAGAVTVKGNNALDHEGTGSYAVVITASDGTLGTPHNMTITVGNSNEAPYFVNPTLEVDVEEDTAVGEEIASYTAGDADGNVLTFSLKNQDDTQHFSLDGQSGSLTIAQELNYEEQTVHLVEINVTDPDEATAEIQLTVNVINVNDNYPQWNNMPPSQNLSAVENTVRGTVLSNYGATDADGQDVTYSLDAEGAKLFSIDSHGNLKTLASLDADRQVPCGANGCEVTVYATDVENSSVVERDGRKRQSVDVTITVTAIEDSVSTLDVSKANPVPGTEMGNPYSALSNPESTEILYGGAGKGHVNRR